MKTIEELAIENGVLKLHEQSLEGDVYVVGNVTLTNLKSLCKAYMQDRLESLEPFGFVSELRVKRFKTGRPAAITQKQTKISNIPLHDISTLKEVK